MHTAILRGDYAQPVAVKISALRFSSTGRNSMRQETTVVHSGLHPERHQGAVNPPVFHASTILSQTVEEYRRGRKNWILEQPALTTALRYSDYRIVAGGDRRARRRHRSVVYPSGLAACAGALLAFLSAGDHLLMSDTVYGPTRNFAKDSLNASA